eukprot:COSAG01_NODE_3548_length_5952_cov_7.082564_11_plen_137_part_00
MCRTRSPPPPPTRCLASSAPPPVPITMLSPPALALIGAGCTIGLAAALPPAPGESMALLRDGSVSNDGSDYSQVGNPGHAWFERVPDDADAPPGAATGYWLDDALKGPDHAACLDGTAPLYYHRAGTGTGANKWCE